MTYETPHALRAALEQRLLNRSRDSGVGLDRLRRRVIFERVLSRLQAAEPGQWVLKGGMALEVRLKDSARLTKDMDLGLRAAGIDGEPLRERLIEALGADVFGDRFELEVGPARRLVEDGDVSLPNSLAFAEVRSPEIEVIDIPRHAAEKFHAMTKDFGERENSRVRDLVDLVVLHEHDLLSPGPAATAVRNVWSERERAAPPSELPQLPESWDERYSAFAAELGLQASQRAVHQVAHVGKTPKYDLRVCTTDTAP